MNTGHTRLIGNIVSLLESGNEYQGFRYFNLKTSTSLPALEWTREVVGALMQVVAKHVESRHKPEEGAGRFKAIITFPKPTPKNVHKAQPA